MMNNFPYKGKGFHSEDGHLSKNQQKWAWGKFWERVWSGSGIKWKISKIGTANMYDSPHSFKEAIDHKGRLKTGTNKRVLNVKLKKKMCETCARGSKMKPWETLRQWDSHSLHFTYHEHLYRHGPRWQSEITMKKKWVDPWYRS